MKKQKVQITQLLTKLLVFVLVLVAKVVFGIAKITKKGNGTSLPGLLVEKFCPWILTSLTKDLEQIILITGTNGKTTTRALLVHIFEKNGYLICTNRGGANIMRGVAASLLLNKNWKTKDKANIAILEIEEATLPILTRFVLPNSLILTNIFRDQLDAYGEIDQTLSYFSNSINQITKNSCDSQKFRNNFDQKESNSQDFNTNNSQKNWQNKLKILDKNALNQANQSIGQNIGQNNNSQKINSEYTVDNSQNNENLTSSLPKNKNNPKLTIVAIGEKIKNIFKIKSQTKKNNSQKSVEKSSKFQGFFGRQFPKENIYENDFDNSKKNFEESFENFDLVSKGGNNSKPTNLQNFEDYPQKLAKKTTPNSLVLQSSIDNSNHSQWENQTKIQNSKIEDSEKNLKNDQISKNKSEFVPEFNVAKISNISLLDKAEKLEKTKKTFLPQIIANIDDQKLLTCLQNCSLPIVGFELDTDDANKPKFEESEIIFKPNFTTTFTAKNILIRNNLSHFIVEISDNSTQNQEKITIESQLPGFFNLYNILAAISIAIPILGKNTSNFVADFGPVFGRGEIIKIKNNQVKLFLVKNPAGFEQVLELIGNKITQNKNISKQNELNLAFLINDKIADGRDLSWLWDVGFENFLANNKVNQILTGGIRGADMLLRLEMANWQAKISDNQNSNQLIGTILDSQKDWIICATYTAMLEIRTKLGKHTKLKNIDSIGY